MIEENPARSDSASSESETGNLRDRVQTLQEKSSDLSRTLDGIERDLREAAGETNK